MWGSPPHFPKRKKEKKIVWNKRERRKLIGS